MKRKSEEWLYVMSEVLEICAIHPLVECEDTIKAMIGSKKERLDKVIAYCREREYKSTVEYLENAKGDMFTAIDNKLHGKTTSKVERVFRTEQKIKGQVSIFHKSNFFDKIKATLSSKEIKWLGRYA